MTLCSDSSHRLSHALAYVGMAILVATARLQGDANASQEEQFRWEDLILLEM